MTSVLRQAQKEAARSGDGDARRVTAVSRAGGLQQASAAQLPPDRTGDSLTGAPGRKGHARKQARQPAAKLVGPDLAPRMAFGRYRHLAAGR